MYAEYFGLTSEPFSLTPDPAYLYLSPEHREAIAALQYGLLDGRGFITLVGEVGTGKTTILYSLLGRLGSDIQTAYVAYTTQSFEDMLAAALKDLKVDFAGHHKRELLDALNAYLLKRADEGLSTALIIDEAQNLSDTTFEELRLLSNFETYERKLLQIVLVGQPELQDRLRQPQLRQLRERVSVRAVVNPLSRAEMTRYIEHRLERVGGSVNRLMDPRALARIVARTQGIPRRANILCHSALLFAYGKGIPRVTVPIAREAIAEMDERRPGLLRRSAVRRVRSGVLVRWAVSLAAVGAVAIAGSNPAPLAVFERPVATVSAPPIPVPSEPSVSAVEAPGLAVPTPVQPSTPAPAPMSVGAVLAPAERAPEPVPSGKEPTEQAETMHDAAAQVSDPIPAEAPTHASDIALATPPAPTAAPAPVLLKVHQGATLWSIARGIYGDALTPSRVGDLIAEVQRLNPQIKNRDMIRSGDSLNLPATAPGKSPTTTQ
jgi:general secretion pathway protein A